MAEITKKILKDMCKKQGFYSTPGLNDILYLHYKGFREIKNMEDYTGLKVIYLEGNGLRSMKGLDHQPLMKSLYLQENSLTKIEGLENLPELCNLNLNQNSIEKVENLGEQKMLGTLLLQRNKLKTLDSVQGLLECTSLSCIDMQNNDLEDVEVVDILEQLPNLKVLYLKGNPFVKKIKNYRKTVISRLKNLTYLDDRPVFDEERLLVTAWAAGGKEGEKAERVRQKEEKKEKERQNRVWFTEMVEANRAEARAKAAENGEVFVEEEEDDEVLELKMPATTEPVAVATGDLSDDSFLRSEEKQPSSQKNSSGKGSLIEVVDDEYDSDFDDAPPLEDMDVSQMAKVGSVDIMKKISDMSMSGIPTVEGLLTEADEDNDFDELD